MRSREVASSVLSSSAAESPGAPGCATPPRSRRLQRLQRRFMARAGSRLQTVHPATRYRPLSYSQPSAPRSTDPKPKPRSPVGNGWAWAPLGTPIRLQPVLALLFVYPGAERRANPARRASVFDGALGRRPSRRSALPWLCAPPSSRLIAQCRRCRARTWHSCTVANRE